MPELPDVVVYIEALEERVLNEPIDKIRIVSPFIVRSFEPGEEWFWDYLAGVPARPVPLSPPFSRPEDQPVPGPEGRVPPNWTSLLHRPGE
jgi:hypothetical protein